MEALLSRFRNLTVLLVAVVVQSLYLALSGQDQSRRAAHPCLGCHCRHSYGRDRRAIRHNTIGFLEDDFILLDVREQNRKLKATNDHLKLENTFYRNQLATAEHAVALVQFEQQSPSKTIAARVIGNSTVVSAKAVFIDRGLTSGVESGMAVVTPDRHCRQDRSSLSTGFAGAAGHRSTFKVGVESQKRHVHGVLSCGTGKCIVEQVQNEDKVDAVEWFYILVRTGSFQRVSRSAK